MEREPDRIVLAILHVARKSGALVTSDAATTASAMRELCDRWEAGERGLVTPDLKESPAWAAYEMKVFQLGRALDLVQRKLGVWRGRGEVLDTGAWVIGDARFGRGRQSFAATLGMHGLGSYGAELAALLGDEAMSGYAIKALIEGGNGEYVAEVRAAGEHGRPWVRNASRVYLARFASRSSKRTRSARPVTSA